MEQHSITEIDTHVLAAELRKLNAKRTPGEWRLYADKYIVEQDRLAPHLAQTGGIRAKANADYLFYLASNTTTIIERLERLARLEKLIDQLPSGDTVPNAEATSTQSATPSGAGGAL